PRAVALDGHLRLVSIRGAGQHWSGAAVAHRVDAAPARHWEQAHPDCWQRGAGAGRPGENSALAPAGLRRDRLLGRERAARGRLRGANRGQPERGRFGGAEQPRGRGIVALRHSSSDAVLDIMDLLDGTNVEVRVFPDVVQMITQDAGIDDLNGLPLVALRQSRLRGNNVIIKRAMDVAVSTFVLVFVSPI